MKLVIIVGGSSGIGLAAMQSLSKDYKVVNLSRSKAEGFDNIETDVTSFESVKNAFKKVEENFGAPDIMIYCSGFVEPEGLLEMSPDNWQKTIETNLSGAFFCTQEYVRISKNKKGKILYIASTAGTRAQPGWSAYAASKAGLINFSLTMAEELHDYKIKVYCLAPGRCATPLRKILAPNEDPSKIMQPNEVAEFIEYIIKNDNVIDNQVITVKRIN